MVIKNISKNIHNFKPVAKMKNSSQAKQDKDRCVSKDTYNNELKYKNNKT